MHAAELVLAGRYIKCSVAARDLYPDVRWAEHLINVYHRKIRASADLSHAVKVKYPAPEPAAAPPTPAVVTPTPAMATPSPSAPSPMREGYRKCGGTFVEYQVRPHALPCPALAPALAPRTDSAPPAHRLRWWTLLHATTARTPASARCARRSSSRALSTASECPRERRVDQGRQARPLAARGCVLDAADSHRHPPQGVRGRWGAGDGPGGGPAWCWACPA